jgi:hypothetical protein
MSLRNGIFEALTAFIMKILSLLNTTPSRPVNVKVFRYKPGVALGVPGG